jgi:hypothetical protein
MLRIISIFSKKTNCENTRFLLGQLFRGVKKALYIALDRPSLLRLMRGRICYRLVILWVAATALFLGSCAANEKVATAAPHRMEGPYCPGY